MGKKGKNNPKKNISLVAYQNKDITAKMLADRFKGETLKAYGLSQLPMVKDVRPTNLPAVVANELKLDNLFYFEDDSVGILDYESKYAEQNKVKYYGYIARLLKRIYTEEKRFRKLRVIIIHTGDVKRGSTVPHLDLGGTTLTLTEAFLSDLEGDEIRDRIKTKLEQHIPLDDQDLMQLIIFPLSFGDDARKQLAVREAIDLAEQITDQSELSFALTGIRVFAEKVIRAEDAERIERRLGMVKVIEPIIEKAAKKAAEEAAKEAAKEAKENTQRRIAKNLLLYGIGVAAVAENTGLSVKQVEALQREAAL